VDVKGLGKEKSRVMTLLEKCEIEIVKI
jgi:hypothetical protein